MSQGVVSINGADHLNSGQYAWRSTTSEATPIRWVITVAVGAGIGAYWAGKGLAAFGEKIYDKL